MLARTFARMIRMANFVRPELAIKCFDQLNSIKQEITEKCLDMLEMFQEVYQMIKMSIQTIFALWLYRLRWTLSSNSRELEVFASVWRKPTGHRAS